MITFDFVVQVANLKFLGVQLKAAPEKPSGMMNAAKTM
jgi:hypothetical protein